MLDDAVVRRIADSRGRSPAQVVLRWHIQRGDIVFPKSVSADRMRTTSICSTLNWMVLIWTRSRLSTEVNPVEPGPIRTSRPHPRLVVRTGSC